MLCQKERPLEVSMGLQERPSRGVRSVNGTVQHPQTEVPVDTWRSHRKCKDECVPTKFVVNEQL